MQQSERTCSEVIAAKGAGPRLEEFKKLGKEKKCCPLCDRHMNSQELRVFETKVSTLAGFPRRIRPISSGSQVDDELVKSTPASIKETEKDLAEWERILQRLQIASQRVVTRDKLKNTEIPALEIQIKQTESELSEAKVADEEVCTCIRSLWGNTDQCFPLGLSTRGRCEERARGASFPEASSSNYLQDSARHVHAQTGNQHARDGSPRRRFYEDNRRSSS